MPVMLEWPGRCSHCKQAIDDWSDAGLFDKRWVHKACYFEQRAAAQTRGADAEELRSPIDRGKLLEWPMLLFLLMFHFGLGAAVAGWIMIDQDQTPSLGAALMAVGIVVPLIGVAGVALNVISRRRIELIRQAVDARGGWKPGR